MAQTPSPQNTPVVKLQGIPETRTRAIAATPISTNFLQNIGQAANIVARDMDVKNDSSTTFIKNRFQEEAEKIRLEVEGGVLSSTGLDTLKTSKEGSETLAKRLEEQKAKYDAKYHPIFDTEIQNIQNKYTRSTQPYTVGQVKKVEQDTFNANISTLMNDTITGSADTDLYPARLQLIRDKVREKAMFTYGEDENAMTPSGMPLKDLINNEVAAAESKTVGNSIIALAKNQRLDLARDMFSEYDKSLLPAERNKAIAAINSAMESNQSKVASGLVDQVRRTTADPSEQAKLIYDLAPNDKTARTMDAINKSLTASAEKSTKIQNDLQKENVIKSLTQDNKNLNDPEVQAMLQKLPADEQTAILDRVSKNGGSYYAKVTDKKVYDRTVDKIYNATAEQLNEPGFLNDAFGASSVEDARRLQGMYDKRKANFADESRKLQNDLSSYMYNDLRSLSDGMGYTDKQEAGQFMSVAMGYAEELIEQNPKITREELRKKVRATAYDQAKTLVTPEKKSTWANPSKWFSEGIRFTSEDAQYALPNKFSQTGNPTTYTEEDQAAFRERAINEYKTKFKQEPPADKVELLLRQRMRQGKPLK